MVVSVMMLSVAPVAAAAEADGDAIRYVAATRVSSIGEACEGDDIVVEAPLVGGVADVDVAEAVRICLLDELSVPVAFSYEVVEADAVAGEPEATATRACESGSADGAVDIVVPEGCGALRVILHAGATTATITIK